MPPPGSRPLTPQKPWYCHLRALTQRASKRRAHIPAADYMEQEVATKNERNHLWERSGFQRSFILDVRSSKRDDTVNKIADVWENSLDGDVCLLKDSPFRILREDRWVKLTTSGVIGQDSIKMLKVVLKAAESGNLEDFNRLYLSDPSRLSVRDSKGRTPAHQAALRNRVNILQFIRNHNGDLDVQDVSGNTPLHVAIENESIDAVKFLLQNNVDTTIQNKKKQAPLHLAAEQNKINVLKAMALYRHKINPHQGGEHGRTALHLAAVYDYAECAYILITEFGAKTRQPCNNGYYPIHEAAKNASSHVMEVFLQWGESCGNTREQMISFFDAEGNVPLHSAIHSGDFKAVELCLKSGAKISTQQHDMSTPVHLACSQGAIDIVKLMFSLQPEEKMQCLKSYDVQKMTPIHCAAMFDRLEIVKYLIEEGADINASDKENRSPLLLAASRCCWKTVKTLIELGADIHLKDSNQRNILHLMVLKGGNVEELAQCVIKARCIEMFQQLLDENDNKGCTPMHYACQGGYIKSLENLLKYGACINLKNNEKETPLHLAAWHGRINILKKLLDSEKGTFIINEANGGGLTPLHIASKRGHTSVVQLLLNRGALLHRDHNGRNPLHLAAMAGCTRTMELLHSVHSHLLDQTDKDRNTALHLATMENKPHAVTLLLALNCKLLSNVQDLSAIDYAIYYKFPEVALAMVTHEERGQEVMSLKSDKHPCVTLALIAIMPRVFEAVQDKCITKANCKKDSKLYYIKYSFSCLRCPGEQKQLTGSITVPDPLPALNAMVAHGRVELLAHPLSEKYLEMKWNSYGKYFHLVHLLLYSIFLILVTFFSSNLMSDQLPKPADVNQNVTQSILLQLNNTSISVQRTPAMFITAICIMVYIVVNILRECLQIYQQNWAYLTDPTNLVYILLYISTTITVSPPLFGCFADLQISCASITVFLSWFTLLLNLQRFDHVGIYVVMFLEILQTLIKVLIVFSILIVAFGLAFYILLSRGNHLSFSSVPISIMRTFAMMLGEIDFLGTYVYPYYNPGDDDKVIPYPLSVFIILGVFMVLMPILLMNLLIGLAVGDIESVKRNAQLKRLAMQVLLHTELERKLPQKLLEKIDKTELIEYPNERKSKIGFLDFFFKIWFYHAFSEEGIEQVLERKEDYGMSELDLMNLKLKKISDMIERQRFLLKLVTEKMGIKAEYDEIDEGVSSDDCHDATGSTMNANNINNSNNINNKVGLRFRKKLRSMGQSFNKSFVK